MYISTHIKGRERERDRENGKMFNTVKINEFPILYTETTVFIYLFFNTIF